MLENIKLLLNVTDDKHDNIILLYLDKISTIIHLHYSNQEL